MTIKQITQRQVDYSALLVTQKNIAFENNINDNKSNDDKNNICHVCSCISQHMLCLRDAS